MSELDHLRPHHLTGDDAPVSYRAKHIRALFAEIERLQAENAELLSGMERMADIMEAAADAMGSVKRDDVKGVCAALAKAMTARATLAQKEG